MKVEKVKGEMVKVETPTSASTDGLEPMHSGDSSSEPSSSISGDDGVTPSTPRSFASTETRLKKAAAKGQTMLRRLRPRSSEEWEQEEFACWQQQVRNDKTQNPKQKNETRRKRKQKQKNKKKTYCEAYYHFVFVTPS